MMSATAVLILMTALFLGFGYMGVPVVFALMAGVLLASAFTPISMQSLVGQLFHGIDSDTLLAVPFFQPQISCSSVNSKMRTPAIGTIAV